MSQSKLNFKPSTAHDAHTYHLLIAYIESWTELKGRKELVLRGWEKCCTSLYNVNDPAKRHEAVVAVAKQELEHSFVPLEEEGADQYVESNGSDSDGEEDPEDPEDELDISMAINFGERRSTRVKQPVQRMGYFINSGAVVQTSDSESENK